MGTRIKRKIVASVLCDSSHDRQKTTRELARTRTNENPENDRRKQSHFPGDRDHNSHPNHRESSSSSSVASHFHSLYPRQSSRSLPQSDSVSHGNAQVDCPIRIGGRNLLPSRHNLNSIGGLILEDDLCSVEDKMHVS